MEARGFAALGDGTQTTQILGQAEAAQGNTKRATKLLRASGKSLRKLTGLIAAAAKKNQIISSLAGQLTSAAAGANTAIDTVRASLTP